MTTGFDGQRVVIIGGTSGIGLAVGRAAGGEGALVTVASRHKDKIDDALDQLPEGTRGHQLDATDEDAVRAFFERVGGFDHLVYTAGRPIAFRTLRDITSDEAHGCFQTQFWGAYMAVKYGAERISPGGSIVLTSGIVATRPVPTVAAGAAAAGATESLTRALAVELAPLRVNAVRLGPIETRADADRAHLVPDSEELFRAIREKLLTRRMGTPAEAAAAYLYLMRGGFTTGTVLTTDGGYLLV